eukprot:6491695-Amphidinium_carterae.1
MKHEHWNDCKHSVRDMKPDKHKVSTTSTSVTLKVSETIRTCNKGGSFDEGCHCERCAGQETVGLQTDKCKSKSGSLSDGRHTPSCNESPRTRGARRGQGRNVGKHTSRRRKARNTGQGEAVRKRR